LDKILNQMKSAPQNVRFSDLAAVCAHDFGEPRQQGTSHHVYKTPWPGDPAGEYPESQERQGKSLSGETGARRYQKAERATEEAKRTTQGEGR
jgi:hypothetical protein